MSFSSSGSPPKGAPHVSVNLLVGCGSTGQPLCSFLSGFSWTHCSQKPGELHRRQTPKSMPWGMSPDVFKVSSLWLVELGCGVSGRGGERAVCSPSANHPVSSGALRLLGLDPESRDTSTEWAHLSLLLVPLVGTSNSDCRSSARRDALLSHCSLPVSLPAHAHKVSSLLSFVFKQLILPCRSSLYIVTINLFISLS